MSPSAYITEVAYLRQFCKELSPTMLRAAAALGGVDATESADFDYCELGSGMGDTTCTLAAAYPRARFVGVDFNPEHVTFARSMATRGGLTNVSFLDSDFEQLGSDALPDLDYVCAHGVLAWITPDKRRALIALAASRLKPGGLLYVSYNAMPGWAAVEPLRRLLLDSAGTEGDRLEQARRALDAARLLRDRGAKYFTSNPAALEMLATSEKVGPSYVVHEYLQDHWQPMYFTDVAREMAAAGLHFAGELPLFRNVARLTIPEALAGLVHAAADRIEAERLKDYATNTSFRGDVYIKGVPAPDGAVVRRYLDETRFTTLVTAERVRRELRLPHHELHLSDEPFDTMLAVLSERPASASALAQAPALASLGADRLRESLLDLLAGEQIVPLAPGAHEAGDAARYNQSILEQPLAETHPVVLASPQTGTGVTVSSLQAVCLRLLTRVAPGDRAAWIRAFVERQPVRLHVRDRPVSDRAEQAQVIAHEVDKFREHRLPKLVALGVVKEA